MSSTSGIRSVLAAGRPWLAVLALSCAVAKAAPDNIDVLLKRADSIKAANQVEFIRNLRQLEGRSSELSPAQAEYLRYLEAWQYGYSGDYKDAIPQLDAIIANSKDVTLRFRASVSIINILEIDSHNEEGYERLSQLVDMLPQVPDPGTRLLGVAVAAQLYNFAGQYDLALSYADKLIAAPKEYSMTCKGHWFRIDSLFRSGKLSWPSEDISSAIAACANVNEPITANLIRVDIAKLDLAQGRYADAIALLNDNYEVAGKTRYPFLISSFDSVLGLAYLQTGDLEKAQTYAQRAVENGADKGYTQAQADAYEALYKIAVKHGDYQAALGYHEKYAAADKGYLNDTSARALAYQMVKQQVQEKKAQVDALNKQNQVLTLKQTVNRKNMIAVELGVALLLVVLGSIGMYAYRTKKSQLKFRKLARRDGLTEIFNRQYFVEVAEQELEYCRKSVRDVSVVAIDLDHFKLINDNHGHAAGDFALKRAVVACQKHLRSVDVFGRLGGEEFGIMMPDCVPERAIDIAEKMRQEIASLKGTEGEPDFEVTASFGVTAARWSGYNLLQLLAQADSALYQAKREGRNRVVAIAGPPAANSGAPAADVSDWRRALT
ncbi:MAG TPA: tetratricopeptide repeat-containing diguanylate cyclase [Xanthomonadaceae bacterium]|jgi:diguanylate cyclase (GGDEF)-like protein